jgi:electron transfer flavoprotein alpha subunit
MADVLAVCEVRDGAVRGVSREVVGAAARLAGELGGSTHALLLGPPGVGSGAADLGEIGADRIYVAEDDDFGLYHPEASVRAVAELNGSGAYGAILFPATAQGKDLAPRCAARLDCGLATDATEVEVEKEGLVVTRPLYAGKALARMKFAAAPALVSLRPNVFSPDPRPAAGEIVALEVASEPRRIRVREIEAGERGKLDVAEASVVVSGGRGLQDADHWALLEDLVDALGEGAALGASRAVVDAGWRPHGEQVGQTGKTVAPNLYFAVGISGAIQHLAGMRTANVIVAINKDPEAPIFGVADYGIVGDLFEVLPRLAEEIRAVRAAQ